MSESNTLFKYFLSQHPLYQAVEKCIDRGVTDTYNYHDFFPLGMVEWWITKQSSRSYLELIKAD